MARTTGALDSWQLFSTFAWLSGGERYTENALRPKSIHAQAVRVSCDCSVHTPYTYTLRIGNRTHSRKAWNEISTREPQVQRKSLSPFLCSCCSLCLSQIFYTRVPWKGASAEIGFVCWTSKQQFQIFFTVRLGALVRRGWKKEREEYTDRPKKKKKNWNAGSAWIIWKVTRFEIAFGSSSTMRDVVRGVCDERLARISSTTFVEDLEKRIVATLY